MNKFYKSLAAIAVCALSALTGWAYDFEEGGLYYNISGTEVALTTGDVAYSGDIVIPATVEHDGTTYTVTVVGNVFKDNTTVTGLKLPETVTSLPASCFANMTGLLELEIPNVNELPNYLCDGCSALTTVTFGEGVHWASIYMMRNCSSLRKVTMLSEEPVGWNVPGTIPTTYAHMCKPITNAIQQQSTLYIPYGTTQAYKTVTNIGLQAGGTTMWNKFGAYVELDPPGGNVDVESITIAPENPVLAAEEGATVQLTATVLPENATDKTIVWTTSDASVATVNANGLVTRTAALTNAGDQPYTVTITASGANDVVASVTVTAEVLADVPVTGIEITPANPVLAAEDGATVQLTATVTPENALDPTVTWSSANEAIATVDQNGLVTRTAPLYNNDVPYTVVITATAASGVTQTVTVTAEVLETVLPTAISITPTDPVLAAVAGATVQLTANYEPENATDRFATWTSADETIATVDQNGLVTRTAPLTSDDEQPYTVVITATTPNGLTANVTVTANVKGDEFFREDGIYYNVLSADDLTVEVTNSVGGTANDVECYSGEIEIPATVTHKNITYQVIRIGDRAFADNALVTKLTLNEGLESIAPYGVRGMTGINELVLPQSVTRLEAFGFARMAVEHVTIPNVADLPQSLFSNCTALRTLTLGAGVRTLGNNLNNNVTTIQTVTCYATTPPTWENAMSQFAPFANAVGTATLYVPEGSYDAYYNARSTYQGNSTYYWRFRTIEEMLDPLPEKTLAEALAEPSDEDIRISEELLIADVEEDGTAILTDNNGNWIATTFDSASRQALVYAKSVKAGTLRGVVSDLTTNPVIALTGKPKAGESTEEVQPVVIDMTQLIDVPGNCIARVAGFYADGVLRAYSNPEDPGQKLVIDNTYIGEALESESFINKNVELTAIVRLNSAWEAEEDPSGNAPRRAHKTDMNSCTNYTITPVGGSVSEDIVTAVADLNSDVPVQSVTYVNAAGISASKPFDGLNIVVTRHTDGSVTATKMVK